MGEAKGEVRSASTKKYCIPLNVPLRNVSMYIVYSERFICMNATDKNCGISMNRANSYTVMVKKRMAAEICFLTNFV